MQSYRCYQCECKISQTNVITNRCRCGNTFCSLHRIDHGCCFDYKKDYQDRNTLVKVVGDKIDKI